MLPSLPPAGMEMVVARLTRGLARRGHDVGVTCIESKGALATELERDGHRVTLVRTPGLRTLVAPVHLRRWLRQRKPDVVHIHSGAWLKSARAAMMARVPRVIYTMHGFDGTLPWYDPFLDRLAARYTTVAVAVSEALVPYLVTRVGLPTNRVRVVANGIDVEMFHPGPRSGAVRKMLGLGEDDIIVGHVARFAPVKNHAMLVDAFARVLAIQPQAFLALIGDGPLRKKIEAQVDALDIRSRIGFLGQLADLPRVYRDLDVLVLPSLSEATSMSILEGMATGLAVVATDVGGTPQLLGEGEAGILVPSNDPQALADALVTIIGAPGERRQLGRAARNRVEVSYSEDRMLARYEALYAGIADDST